MFFPYLKSVGQTRPKRKIEEMDDTDWYPDSELVCVGVKEVNLLVERDTYVRHEMTWIE